jgi:FMN phosphatase YigB (HAD superfamily)
MDFQNLLLDLDGTLIYSGSSLIGLEFIGRILPLMKKHRGWKAAFRALKNSRDSIKFPSKTQTNHVRMVEAFEKTLSLTKIEAEKHLYEALLAVFPRLEPHFGEITGAAEFTEWAKEKFTLTLTTNPVWPVELVHMRMRWGGINPAHFKSITTSDRMHACKPTPEYYREVLEQENFSPRSCLLIGNERKMDLPATKVDIAVFLIRPKAKTLTCLHERTEKHPGAWRGNYQHLKQFLSSKKN